MPTEIHEHYDAENTLTGTTVVTRESPWDETTRARALSLEAWESDLCKCGCGRPASESYDSKQAYKVTSFKCVAGRAIAIQRKKDADQAKKDRLPDGWDDGLHYYAEPVKGADDDG